ncbi:ABC transporter substrate-binding protein [Providencia hangzhouensis]|uniref:ABC transporter substrate-binding protein n=1 Tax=Providencia rettgeri TaxID=587 RepID=A0AAJ4NGW2_PRORE|nr:MULTISPECIES: ABC transporter substrate-binding protein [Providencia]MBJ9970087.1 ABC transporter substrate-binding protein [Providencia rettgeri]MCF8962440.1 Phosphoglycerate transport regulatory protein PgtC [Providencia rettgeri]QWQ16476.1 ABC transporter substrate-binding protein [Providencia rettgeri]QWQ20310.1 ABC transporter substrate-binding protein [Providencia rettgeri]QWQ24146.1 ABC transporter substrate-binding protein [Providencia rettgeri]
MRNLLSKNGFLLKGITMSLGLSCALFSVSTQAITVYTAGPGAMAKQLAAGFEKQTGTKVDVFQATTGKVMARLEAEQANPRADVLISASWDTAVDLQQKGWLLPYESPNAQQVPERFKAPYYVAQGISALGIVWNNQSGTPKPTDWQDLAQPEFKDKVTMPDPALSGASLDLVLGLQNAKKEAAWTLFSDLKANGMVISGPNAQALTPVLQGAKAAVFGAVDYVAYGSIANGESIEVIFPSSGTAIAPRPMMILKSSKQPDQAKAFIDYVLSPEGQEIVANAWLMPARADIAGKRPDFSTLKLLPEAATDNAERGEVLSRLSALFR